MDAMPYILKAAAHPDSKYRSAAINMTELIQGDEVVCQMDKIFPKALPAAKSEILNMLGTAKMLRLWVL